MPKAVERGRTETGDDPGRFAARSVKLLLILLILITLVGEVVLGLSLLYTVESDRRLMLWFTVIMLPYVMLVCGGAFLSGILQVHKRFSVPAFAPVLLNLVHIGVVILGAWFLGLRGRDEISPVVIQQQTSLAFYLAWGVLLAGVFASTDSLAGIKRGRVSVFDFFKDLDPRHSENAALILAGGAGSCGFADQCSSG
ncbi:MAG: hypothetical protein KatS3mg104_1207 [Phycisphaerae bacterium]|nr:MAG: hypothetical protein KatS3mg104_1207 [Phycisphaerae bacterium]